MDSSSGIKRKFCESLDRFVDIRSFTPQQRKELFQNVRITDRKSYKRLIINAAVVNYLDEIAPSVFSNDEYPLLGEIIEQELYALCIKVNPGLDIKEVTIQVEEQSSARQIPLLGYSAEPEPIPENDRLLHMAEELRRRVIGQDQAIDVVCQAIRKAKVGLRNPRKPIGSFVFVGQTGVGKTELARTLTAFLFGSELEMIRVDCSEYAMSHEYAKLIGAPPGYIGHNEGGFLTEAVKGKPRSVVVFDEVEKAHRKVHNVLLQVLEEGMLTDGRGQQISFRDTVVIMTSNIGVESLERLEGAIWFSQQKTKIDHDVKARETRKALEKYFPPEFLNRIDEIVTFNALGREDCRKIISLMLEEVAERLRNLGLTMEVPPPVMEFLVDHGTDAKYGARPLKRAIHRFVENPLAGLILSSAICKNDHIVAELNAEQDAIVFRTSEDRKDPPPPSDS
ncbi:MAG: ATP-dependent Clp protease ATP-binding subunit [Candidatus Riflebacteria bacterium]|nr:ATP-dependent Clp protease ATP-binding subunit [Candidatus Riflebacteria bacterium]